MYPNSISIFTDMTNTVSSNPISSWFWEIDGNIFTSQNTDYVFSNPGLYEIKLTVTPQNACAITTTKQITINPLPEVSFSYQDACDNQFVTFTDESTSSSSPIISRSWDFAGNSNANGREASIQFLSLEATKNKDIKENNDWFLALSYLKQKEKRTEAKQLLETIRQTPKHQYLNKASVILNQLPDE